MTTCLICDRICQKRDELFTYRWILISHCHLANIVRLVTLEIESMDKNFSFTAHLILFAIKDWQSEIEIENCKWCVFLTHNMCHIIRQLSAIRLNGENHLVDIFPRYSFYSSNCTLLKVIKNWWVGSEFTIATAGLLMLAFLAHHIALERALGSFHNTDN